MRRLMAVAAAGGLLLAGFGVAAAQTAEDRPEATTAPGPPVHEVVPAVPFPGGGDRIFWRGHPKFGAGGPHEMGIGPFGGIHGESTTRNPDGEGFRTMAHQFGEVTDVSDSSLTVKSEDGYERTYAISEDTLVNAGRDGIADVKKGDDVRVMALVEGDRAKAHSVIDETNLKRIAGNAWPKGKQGR